MKNKFITDELITQRMESKGWIEGCDDEHAKNQVLAHFECEITDQWQNPDFSVYEESTADGYSIWIATDDDKRINVNEDVYYYENELTDVLYEAIPDYSNIYVITMTSLKMLLLDTMKTYYVKWKMKL